MGDVRSIEVLVEDFEWTRPYHRGDVLLAAERLGMTHAALSKQLFRAVRRGLQVGQFFHVSSGHDYA